jgi:hypothetical protein
MANDNIVWNGHAVAECKPKRSLGNSPTDLNLLLILQTLIMRKCSLLLSIQIPSFNGSSYLKYGGLGLTRVLSWLELEIVIKPDGMDGLIMYNGYKTDGMGDFISVVIDQGYIEFAMDLGTGAAIIR